MSETLLGPVSVDVDGWTLESNGATPVTPDALKAAFGEAPVVAPDATSDALATPETPAPEAAAPTEPIAPETPATAAVETPASSADAPKRGTKAHAEKRVEDLRRDINQLTRQKSITEQELSTLAQKRQQLADEIASFDARRSARPTLVAPVAPVVPPTPQTPKPDWAHYEAAGRNYDEYTTDLARWHAAEMLAAERVKIQQEFDAKIQSTLAERDAAARLAREQEQAARALEAVDAQHRARLVAAVEKYPELRSIDPNQPISPPMIDCIKQSDLGPELMLYLHRHPDEAEAIARMHPIRALVAMGRIEGEIKATAAANSASAPPLVSQARPPVQAVVGSSARARDVGPPSVADLSEQDFGPDWLAAEEAREREALKRRGA